MEFVGAARAGKCRRISLSAGLQSLRTGCCVENLEFTCSLWMSFHFQWILFITEESFQLSSGTREKSKNSVKIKLHSLVKLSSRLRDNKGRRHPQVCANSVTKLSLRLIKRKPRLFKLPDYLRGQVRPIATGDDRDAGSLSSVRNDDTLVLWDPMVNEMKICRYYMFVLRLICINFSP